MMNSDILILDQILRDRFPEVQPNPDFGWSCPPLDVIDCVLSLNRRYKEFVLPRVYTFKRRHPEIQQLDQLRLLIEEYPNPGSFSLQELDYNHAARAETLLGVCLYLLNVQTKYPADTERERLLCWAVAARPNDASSVNVKGFGLAGFQYLRMLLGAQTTKPDIYIIRFVSAAINRQVTDVEALFLMEQAAARANLPIREVDGAIWQAGAQKD